MSETHPLSVISICGSLRKGSFNAAIQRTLPELAPTGMTITALSGVGDLPLYNADVQAESFPKGVTDMGDAIRKADGLVFCSPEYNYSIPGVLKNVMVLVEAIVFNRPEVFVGSAQTKFDADLKLTDQATRDIIKQQLAGFATFIRRVAN